METTSQLSNIGSMHTIQFIRIRLRIDFACISGDHNYIHFTDSIIGTTLRRSFQIPIRPWCLLHPGPVHKVPGGAPGLAFTIRIRDTSRRWYALALAHELVCWCVSWWRAAEVEVCRQSRLRGRIHARPSAGGLAALCASRFFLFYFTFCLLLYVPSRPVPPPALPAGSGPWDPLWVHLDSLSPPTRSSRSPSSPSPFPLPSLPRTIYNSLSIACKCKHRARILASIHWIVNRLATRIESLRISRDAR